MKWTRDSRFANQLGISELPPYFNWSIFFHKTAGNLESQLAYLPRHFAAFFRDKHNLALMASEQNYSHCLQNKQCSPTMRSFFSNSKLMLHFFDRIGKQMASEYHCPLSPNSTDIGSSQIINYNGHFLTKTPPDPPAPHSCLPARQKHGGVSRAGAQDRLPFRSSALLRWSTRCKSLPHIAKIALLS